MIPFIFIFFLQNDNEIKVKVYLCITKDEEILFNRNIFTHEIHVT